MLLCCHSLGDDTVGVAAYPEAAVNTPPARTHRAVVLLPAVSCTGSDRKACQVVNGDGGGEGGQGGHKGHIVWMLWAACKLWQQRCKRYKTLWLQVTETT
eukprot:jgi/Chlat1/5753/Chrsp38S05576